MKIRYSRTLLVSIIVVAALSDETFHAQQTPAAQNLDRLRSRIEAAVRPAQGVVGVSLKHLETGASIAVNADEPFPMASTFKLPVLVQLHPMAKSGLLRWDEVVQVASKDQHLGSGDLTPLYDPPGVALSLRNVANLMMMISDNSAADICLVKAGAANVTAGLRALGINGIRVDRSCQEPILD